MIAGLGNPGRRYERTRHNVGFVVVRRLAERWGVEPPARARHGALVSDGLVRGERCLFALPQRYMNASGGPVSALLQYHRIPLDRLVVVHDDIDLPAGAVRCKRGGGHGGHNGLRDIDRHAGRDYLRVRVGIGRPPEGWDAADYVLGRWTSEEEEGLPEVVERACDAIETIVAEGIEAAMNRFNVRPRPVARAERGGGEAPQEQEQS